jgi:transposase-like protein
MTNSHLYRGFRYPREIISHVVWLYFRFSLSFRDIEELMASRGVIVTYDADPTTIQRTVAGVACVSNNVAVA